MPSIVDCLEDDPDPYEVFWNWFNKVLEDQDLPANISPNYLEITKDIINNF